jgi:HD-GYP domain-containing protein (c-di-GMP phosphodiesterase class II)
MPPINIFRGVTLRLILVSTLIVLLCASIVSLLTTYNHYEKMIEREKDAVAHALAHGPASDARILPALGGQKAARRTLDGLATWLGTRFSGFAHLSLQSAREDGKAAWSRGLRVPPPAADEIRMAGGPERLGFRTLDAEGKRLLVVDRAVGPKGSPSALLRVGVEIPSLWDFLMRLLRDGVFWIAITALLAVIVSITLVSLLTRPLRSVASYAQAIERGESLREIAVGGTDEAATIADAFNVVLLRLKQSYVSTLGALAALLETKDRTTESHSYRGVRYAVELGKAAGLSPQELADLEYGALLHDIGKIGVDDVILKKTGPLTEQEWEIMRQHPAVGYNVLKSLDFLETALPVVLHHQERYDGHEYPHGLKGEQIPLLARIFSVADSFDAMTSNRPYRRAMRPEQALSELRRNAGSQFDPRLAEIFIKLWETGVLAKAEEAPPAIVARN